MSLSILYSFMCVFTLTLSCLAPEVLGQNWLINHLLPDDYDPQQIPIPPNTNETTLRVNSTLYVNKFQASSNELNMITDLYVCLWWQDYRLQRLELDSVQIPGSNITESRYYQQIKLTDLNRLFIPTVYFRNAYFSNVVNNLQDFQYIRVYPENQTLNYCLRLSVHFECRFINRLSNFPFDEQYCYIEMESMGRWSEYIEVHIDSIRMPGGNTQFRVREQITGICESESIDPFYNRYQDFPYNLTMHTCAFARIQMVRNVNYYIIRYFAPSFLLVWMSFLEAWLPTGAWPARIILTCIVELTMKSISISAYNESQSRHVVSLYWWLWICQFFCYMALIEFAMALAWVQFVGDKHIAHANNTESPDGHYFGKRNWYAASGRYIERILHKLFGPIDFFADPVNRNKVDYCARVVFPIVFAFFFFIYIIATYPVWGEKYRRF